MCRVKKTKTNKYVLNQLKKLRRQVIANFLLVAISFIIIFFAKFESGEPPSLFAYLSSDVAFTLLATSVTLLFSRWVEHIYDSFILDTIAVVLLGSVYWLALNNQSKLITLIIGIAILLFLGELITDFFIMRKHIISTLKAQNNEAADADSMSFKEE